MKVNKGMVLNNRYKIEALAGVGGMAEVYRARDLETGKPVAVKALKDEYNGDQEFVRRFDLEARAAASLNHPNIVKVYGVGEDKGMRYIVQEYVEGQSLKDEIKDRGRLDWRVAVPIAIQIALALEDAHAHGIIHRDIKPANILITEDGIAMVTDFGIARAVNANTVTTTAGNALGSVHYFSPEQAKGSLVNDKTDIYSLGILMYELLTGQVPFDGDTPVAIAVKHLQEEPKSPKDLVEDIPIGLADIVLRCLKKSPDDRYPNVRALIDDLDRFTLNPAGRYGVIEKKVLPKHVADVSESTMNRSSDQAMRQMMDLDKDIDKRRFSRVRDGILVTAILALGILALVFGGRYLVKQFGEETLTSSSQSNIFIVPGLVNSSLEEVSAYLRDEGINFKVNQVFSETVAKGYIVEQNFPAGTEISREGTHISGNELILMVSAGSEYTVIPVIDDMTVEDLQVLFSGEDYELQIVQLEKPHVSVPEGGVISINPPPGTRVKKGSQVELTVSSGRNIGAIPDVRKMGVNDAKDRLERSGFEVLVAIPSNLSGVKDLYVITMSPEPGTQNFTGQVTLNAGTYEQAFPTPTPSATPTPEPTETEATTEPPAPSEEQPKPTEPPATEPAPTTEPPATEPTGDAG